jgi:hypothetical protein
LCQGVERSSVFKINDEKIGIHRFIVINDVIKSGIIIMVSATSQLAKTRRRLRFSLTEKEMAKTTVFRD